MPALVECVPNFSEGRDRLKVETIAAAIRSVAEVQVLDLHVDADHNRSVITFAGPPTGVQEAAVLATGVAATLIDLTKQVGEHPRIGATDVVPFVPLEGVTLSDCAALAHGTGEEIWQRYRIPIYFYEAAALHPDRRRLEDIRRGGFEKLREAILSDPLRRPDVGEPRLHPTAGATAVGAREILIAFNVNLNSNDREVALAIARSVRESGGGLPAVKAMGVLLDSKTHAGRAGQAQGQAQVSMNLTDWRKTTVSQALAAVEREARRHDVTIHCTELVGLIPRGALGGLTPEALHLEGFGPQKILENRLKEVFGTS